jgi:hypothetical protein
VAHRGARVGVRGGFLSVPQGHAGVQGGGDESVPHAWVVVLVVLGLGHCRTARVIAVLAIVLDPVWLLQGQLTGSLLAPSGRGLSGSPDLKPVGGRGILESGGNLVDGDVAGVP